MNLVVAACLVASVWAADGSPAGARSTGRCLKVGDNALARDFGQKDLFGVDQTYWISTFVGEEAGADAKKALIISFCANACKGCWKELPFLIDLKDRFGPKGLEIWSVLVDDDADSREAGKKKLEPAKGKFVITRMLVRAMADAFMGSRWDLPSLYLLDQDGKVVLVTIGAGRDEREQKDLQKQMEDAVSRLVE